MAYILGYVIYYIYSVPCRAEFASYLSVYFALYTSMAHCTNASIAREG